MRLGRYILPDLLILITSLLQEQALYIMREHVVIANKLLTDENGCIRRIMMIFNNERGTSQNFLVDYHHSSSNTEHTIQRCSAPDFLPISNFL